MTQDPIDNRGREANGCPDCGMLSCMCFDDDQDREGLDENGNPLFECASWWTGTEWHCPLAGTEECDWECPKR